MESNIISASDLLKNLSEDYQSYEKDFVFCQNEKELKKAKFRLLLSIVFKEYTKAIDDIDNIEKDLLNISDTKYNIMLNNLKKIKHRFNMKDTCDYIIRKLI